MSVPVRYSAAANYAVVDSGLSNTLQQEEQYHQQQQQQLYYCDPFASNNCNFNINNSSNFNGLAQQQQLMQQRSSMSSSVSPSANFALPANNNNTNTTTITNPIITHSNIINMDNNNINNINIVQEQEENHHQDHYQHQLHQEHHQQQDDMDEEEFLRQQRLHILREFGDDDGAIGGVMMEPTTSTMAAAAAAAVAANGSDTAERRTQWRRSDEGRYSEPDAYRLRFNGDIDGTTPPPLPEQQQHTLMDSMYMNMNIDMNNIREHKINDPIDRDLEDQMSSMSVDELYKLLKEFDILQDKYHTVLFLPKESKKEVTSGGRDGSAYVLRCLKMWYELPSDVLFSAMSLVDRFLDRLTVKPKHMACMSVAAFYLAIKQLGLKPIPAEDLVTISQCGCTAGDVERMSKVIANKLGVQMGVSPVTAVSFIRIYYSLFRTLSKHLCPQFAEFYDRYIKLEDLENRLEVLLCHVQVTAACPSIVALATISLHMDFHIKASYPRGQPELREVFNYILFLQKFMGIGDRAFSVSFDVISDILMHYNGQNKQPYRQRLVWRLSSRTLKVLRPTNRFSSDLPTIEEGISNTMDDGCRLRTESTSSEEEEDWPTSPIIPIFEQC